MRKEIEMRLIDNLIRFNNEVSNTENKTKFYMPIEVKYNRNNKWTEWKTDGYGVPLPSNDDTIYVETVNDKLYLIDEDGLGKIIWRYEITESVRRVLNII